MREFRFPQLSGLFRVSSSGIVLILQLVNIILNDITSFTSGSPIIEGSIVKACGVD